MVVLGEGVFRGCRALGSSSSRDGKMAVARWFPELKAERNREGNGTRAVVVVHLDVDGVTGEPTVIAGWRESG